MASKLAYLDVICLYTVHRMSSLTTTIIKKETQGYKKVAVAISNMLQQAAFFRQGKYLDICEQLQQFKYLELLIPTS